MTAPTTGMDRRSFLQGAALTGGALALGGLGVQPAQAQPALRAKIGLALYTVRDLMETDYERILGRVAEIGYKEVQPANGYNDLSPKAFRALLDKNGLKCPSTHSAPTIGPDLEKQWEGFQIMGITSSTEPTPPRAPRPAGQSLGQYKNRNSFWEVEAFAPDQTPLTREAAQRRAARVNEFGKVSMKHGVKILIHNHTNEFEKLVDADMTETDVYLAELDPAVAALELDIGWALIAGADPLELFAKHPGRFPVWHIKDEVGLKTVDKSLRPNQRTSSMAFTPVGRGQVQWRQYFDKAQQAGLQHFFVEQDNASTFGDSLAAARVSFEQLTKILA